MALLIKEIYPAIIGESKASGLPALLIRVSGCNLRCSYCDTRYAYEGGRKRSREELKMISLRSGFSRVLLTGGEPLLQEESINLMSDLVEAGEEVLLETNGSLSIAEVPPKVHIIMDLKTPGSGEASANLYKNLEVLKPEDELKFVLVDLRDYQWAKEIIREFELDKRFLVNFSPAFGLLEPAKLARWILRDKLRVRLNLQIHKMVFPSKKRGI